MQESLHVSLQRWPNERRKVLHFMALSVHLPGAESLQDEMNSLTKWLRNRGVVPAAEVQSGLQVSAATLSRLVRGAGPEVVRLGRARAVRYALAARVGGLPPEVPLYRVDSRGEVQPVATLLTVAGGSSCLRRADGPDDVYVGLPPLLHDMAPAGYLGRRFAERHGALGLPIRLQDWSDEHRLIATARRGEDSPGDIIVGEESLDRFLESETNEVSARDFPRLAGEAAEGGGGSSAAGERPKFTAFVGGRHHIVKFTIGDGSETDLRWRDLMVCEELAARTLAAASVPAAEGRVIDVGERRFLEIPRFDRHGARGRSGVLSLGAVDDELFGFRDNWPSAARRLLADGLISEQDCRRMILLEAFGRLIGNDDRHSGNICFRADELAARPALELTPAFDMLPMSVAPNPGGVPALVFKTPAMRANVIDAWAEAVELATEFWCSVAGDERISPPFREAARVRSRG